MLLICCCNPSTKQIEHTLSTLRFGVNAKKIQNNVKANIVTNNDHKSLKLLIENYERRMTDLAKKASEDQLRILQYQLLFEELIVQRAGLLERIKEANKKKVKILAKNIEEKDLRKFFKMAKSKEVFFKNCGIIMIPKGTKKYNDINTKECWAEGADTKQELKRKFSKEMKDVDKADFMESYAMKAYQQAKADQNSLKQTISKQKEFIENLHQTYQAVCKFVTQMSVTFIWISLC